MEKIKLIETPMTEHVIFTGAGFIRKIMINKRIESGTIVVKIDGVPFELEVFEPFKELQEITFFEKVFVKLGASIQVDTGSSVGVSVTYEN